MYSFDSSSNIRSGPCLGPIMGGFIAQSIGIQYVFYLVAGLSGIAAVIGIPLLRETYAPVIVIRRGKMALDLEEAAAKHPSLVMGKWAYLWLNLKRPVVLFTQSFICFILSLYMAL